MLTADDVSYNSESGETESILSADSFAMLTNLVVPNSLLEQQLIGLQN